MSVDDPQKQRRPMPEADALALLERCSNRGRWGLDDEMGTLNYITPEVRLRALRTVTLGRVISIGKDLDGVVSSRNPRPFIHRMLHMGYGDRTVSTDVTEIAPHGFSVTHMDALGHIYVEGAMYNGRRAEDEVGASGLGFGSIMAAKEGVVTRGVLLDVAGSRGVDWLGPDEEIWPDDLEEAESWAGVRVESGDAVVVRIGLSAREAVEGPEDPSRRAGLMLECVPWLHERQAAVYTGDCFERLPSTYPRLGSPVHQVGFSALGLSILDIPELEELAAVCREVGRHEFLLTYAPLRIPGGTGSAVNPLCIF